MPVSDLDNVCTWDLTTPSVPRRAALSDVTDGTKENDDDPPNDVTMPNADEDNQRAAQLAALNKVAPSLIISVRITAGVPAVLSFSSPTSLLSIGDFTVTDNSTGNTSVSWPTAKLPTPVVQPTVSRNALTSGVAGITAPTNTSIRVATFTDAGAAVDCDWTAAIY